MALISCVGLCYIYIWVMFVQNLWMTLFDIVFYGAPLLVAFFAYRKLRVKYARPMEGGADPKLYIYTLLIASGTYIVWVLFWAVVVRVFLA